MDPCHCSDAGYLITTSMIKVDDCLFAIGVVLSIFSAFVAWDLFSAFAADACGGGAGDGCYPWGTEGPASGSWQHQSKGIYIASGLAIAAVPILSTSSIALKVIRGVQLTSNHRALVGTAHLMTLILIFF